MSSERNAGGWMPKSSLVSLVDDDGSFRKSVVLLLESLDYRVEAFASAADFLESPYLAQTACLIVDVQMPAMTGFDLYRHLLESGHAIPTILVTAMPDDVDRRRALKDGVVCYLSKPISEERLLRCIHEALQSQTPPSPNS
jgi:FixJ family two-component response regulator